MDYLKTRPKLPHLADEFGLKSEKKAQNTELSNSFFASISGLSKIQEVEEVGSMSNDSEAYLDYTINLSKKSNLTKKLPFMKKHFRKYTELPPLSNNEKIAFFQRFLSKLKENPQIYDHFLNEAKKKLILSIPIYSSTEYYYKFIHIQNSKKYRSLSQTPVPTVSRKTPDLEVKRVVNSSPLGFSINERNLLKDLIKFPDSGRYPTLSRTTFSRAESRRSSRPTSKMRRLGKRKFLDRNKPSLIRLYQEICGTPKLSLRLCRLSIQGFTQHLNKRYPTEISESMAKHFDFKNGTLEEFCTEMDKFIGSSDEKHLAFCFDIFDFNKDKYICYQDAYLAMKLREQDYYDNDIIKINKMFDLKKQRKIPTKKESRRSKRRKSVFSSATSENTDEEDEEENKKKSKIPHYNLEKPEALTFEDFCKIDFQGKPQIFIDFLRHSCEFNYTILPVFPTTPPNMTRKNSEDLIVDISQNPGLLESVRQDPNFSYLAELEEAMSLFSGTQLYDLLEKFEILRCKDMKSLKTISKTSMKEKWPELFGAKCDYVAERIYHFLAGPKYEDVTKSRFLNAVHLLLNINNDYFLRGFSFHIYDARGDGVITADEAYNMLEALPVGSPIYYECLRIVNELLASIFGRRITPITTIDFYKFIEFIPDSLFIKEVLEVFQIPLVKLKERANSSFIPIEVKNEEDKKVIETLRLATQEIFI
ncbi:unnamed protein product [Blepharisma stoltei]|uniref:EF-hand domain-containing protein n=1 Tax=Blepharisma stoltei TaxID=1481888 RepID=A0AAU9J389_9CILI|nr:unnamed protein product [Blepharisma stoltei]